MRVINRTFSSFGTLYMPRHNRGAGIGTGVNSAEA